MSPSSQIALQKIVELVTDAEKLLSAAERIFRRELEGALGDNNFSDAIRLEEVLSGATHDTASVLGFYLQDIETLRRRVEVRHRYLQVTNAEFEEIVGQEWSLALVKKIHEQLQSRERLELPEISKFIKEIQHQWSHLPDVRI